FGARDQKKLHDAVHTSIALSLAAGLIMMVVGYFASPLILELMGTPEKVIDNSVLYLQVYFLGIMGVMIYNMGSGILRAVGDSKNPLYFLIISSLTNIVLDLLFVAVFKMGIAGAAWATLISQCLSAVLVIILLIRSKSEYRLILKDIRFEKTMLSSIIRIGLPSGVQNAIVSFSNVIVQSNINSFGASAMAGCGAYTKIDGFAILPVMSFSMAMTTFVGQNLGAKKYDRVKQGAKTGMIMSCSVTAVIALILYLFAPNILTVFSQEKDVLYYGTLMMRTVVPGYLFLAISHALSGVIRGAGLTTVPMIVMVCCWCFLRMGWILSMMPILEDIRVVFWGYPITWTASAICMYLYYKKANWLYR
ncbi:MAG: MATE family efflux transporter, partial [Niameybacter sp.]